MKDLCLYPRYPCRTPCDYVCLALKVAGSASDIADFRDNIPRTDEHGGDNKRGHGFRGRPQPRRLCRLLDDYDYDHGDEKTCIYISSIISIFLIYVDY